MLQPSFASVTMPLKSEVRSVSDGGRRTLDLVLKSQGMSQADITRELDLSPPTITRLLQGFVRDGMVRIAPRQSDRPGNPSVLVTLNPDFAYSIGVALLGDVLSMTLMDFAGQVRAHRSQSMPSMSEAAVSAQLRAFKADIFSDASIDIRRVIGAGVGVSGFYVGKNDWLNPPDYLDDWALRDIGPKLQDILEVAVTVDNDGTMAAIGESLLGVGRRCRDFAYFHLTNGFGGGHIVNGRPMRGYHRNAGEFGGIWGLCCDTYPNLDSLKVILADHGQYFETVEDMVRVIDITTPGVAAWLETAVRPFALLSDIIAYSNDPEMIVIGGRLPRAIAQALVERISIPRPHHRRGVPPPVPKIVAAEAPGDAVAIGAAAVPLQSAFFA